MCIYHGMHMNPIRPSTNWEWGFCAHIHKQHMRIAREPTLMYLRLTVYHLCHGMHMNPTRPKYICMQISAKKPVHMYANFCKKAFTGSYAAHIASLEHTYTRQRSGGIKKGKKQHCIEIYTSVSSLSMRSTDKQIACAYLQMARGSFCKRALHSCIWGSHRFKAHINACVFLYTSPTLDSFTNSMDSVRIFTNNIWNTRESCCKQALHSCIAYLQIWIRWWVMYCIFTNMNQIMSHVSLIYKYESDNQSCIAYLQIWMR